jgi:hypothetical protein
MLAQPGAREEAERAMCARPRYGPPRLCAVCGDLHKDLITLIRYTHRRGLPEGKAVLDHMLVCDKNACRQWVEGIGWHRVD